MEPDVGHNTSYKNIARIVGALFIIGTVSASLSVFITDPILTAPDYLVQLSANEYMVLAGALLIFIMAAACAGTAIWMYPVLKRYNESLALGAVCFRLIEGMLSIVVAISLLALLTLGRESVKAGMPDPSLAGNVILAGHDWVFNVPMLMAWCLAALMYYYVFYRTRLIPRWITAWGIIGIILVIVSSILFLFGLISTSSPVQSLLSFPIALQEMAMAVWLIVKGFDQSALASLASIANSKKAGMTVNAIKQGS